jgi:3-methylfumaryl-CoA hydratase
MTADLQDWVGRAEVTADTVSPRLLEAFCATFDLAPGEEAPLGLHWCLAPPAAAQRALGADGHPAKGGFLPPVALPRRMWAGGALNFHDTLQVGDVVEKRSRIAAVTEKQGRSGAMCFVTVEHEFSTARRGLAISERQDIVYLPAPTGPAPAAGGGAGLRTVQLFRYSALTFNGHRIHYDRTYATEVEFYAGLVVHGPLQATWLLHFAAARGAVTNFRFRGVSPLLDFENFGLHGEADKFWIETAEGRRTMEATV